MSTEALTYKELAERLGIKLASARRTAMRKKWQRIKGNDGETRVLVPIEVLERRDDNHSDSHQVSHDDGPTVRELQARVEALGELLAVERQRTAAVELDRDRWHEIAIRPWWKRLAG